jgi:mono/diheme cytochrome c family protein
VPLLLCLGVVAPGVTGSTAGTLPDFARDVRPILERACLNCHNEKLLQGNLSLATREATLRGGVSGPAVVPGNAEASLLLKRLAAGGSLPRMPVGTPPLTDTEVDVLRAWVDGGAPWGAPRRQQAAAAAGAPDYVREIRPIFERRCVRCHGAAEQRSGLRLDSRTSALRGGLSGAVIVPGDSHRSLLVQRLVGTLAPRMPFEGPPLAAAEVARIRAWIDAGAAGPADSAVAEKRHWAYVKPESVPPPAVQDERLVRNAIDRFVLARLEREGLRPSAEADRPSLIRRLSLDLIGLPPSPAEVDSFVADSRPDAYARLVDRLLASPRYGERWATPWLDLARYADTNGYEKDRRRVAWKYRDWVIRALNADMPFKQFTLEQLAGDMLEQPTADQLVATGFHRNTLLNQEGGIDVEEQRFETLVDRVNTTAAVWLGTTLGCAQCHNHKFDPFSQRDYYRLLAFFDNGQYHVHGDGPKVMDRWIVEPELELPTPEQAQRKAALDAEIAALEHRLAAGGTAFDAALAAWEDERRSAPPAWTVLRPLGASAVNGTTLEAQPDGSLLASGERPDRDSYAVSVRVPFDEPKALRLEVFADGADARVGRAPNGNFVLSGFSAALRRGASELPLPIARAESDLAHPSWPIQDALDDDATTGWSAPDDTQSSHVAVFAPDPAGALRKGDVLVLKLQQTSRQKQHTLRRFRLSATAAALPFAGLPLPAALRAALVEPRAARSEQQQKQLAEHFRAGLPASYADRFRLRAARKERAELGIATAMILRERAGFDRPKTPLRIRGSFLSPGEIVYAGVPAALHPFPEDAPMNRLGLARWLASDENPLTPRVVVNRAWEAFFGRGLVLTSEDFGTQGERPTHPELLDWLAGEFRREGTRLKPLHRLIVTSATYRQASRVTRQLLERDPHNRLLARGPRHRLDAEVVRDAALSAAGLLSDALYGPSVFPDQPEGVWDNPYSDDKWTTSEGLDRYRRSLYTFLRRTAPYPMLATFDAGSRELCLVRRVRTNTPLQALTTLNDPAFFAAARALAARLLREAGKSDAERADYAFRLCTARPPAAAERARLLSFYEEQLARLRGDREAARAIAGDTAGETAPESLAARAAWTLVANVVLNLDETLTKE